MDRQTMDHLVFNITLNQIHKCPKSNQNHQTLIDKSLGLSIQKNTLTKLFIMTFFPICYAHINTFILIS